MTAYLGIAAAVALLAAACVQDAMELPPDMSRLAPEERLQPGDRDDPAFVLECPDLNRAIADLKSERAQCEANIAETRVRDQVAVYLFPWAALLPDPNKAEKDAIQTLEKRVERLDRIHVAKRCAVR
jgi:hypothetical protein